MTLAVNDNVFPEHTALLLPAAGAPGGGLTVTEAVPAAPVHPFSVAVTEYVPALTMPAEGITGFCCVEVKPLGPVHV